MRLSVVPQCHPLTQRVDVLQQADALQLSPRRAELGFHGQTAAPVDPPSTTALGRQRVRGAASTAPP